MNRAAAAVILGVSLAAAGCATQSGYRPALDPYGDQNAQNIARDESECREIARQAAGGTVRETATGATVGGLLGAAAGAAIGAATGSPGKGAAIGAASGGIAGGAYKGLGAQERFKRAFRACMRNRGHNVVD